MTGSSAQLRLTEQSGPKEIVRSGMQADDAGFDVAVSIDHDSPRPTEQGRAGSAWSMLGAIARLDWLRAAAPKA